MTMDQPLTPIQLQHLLIRLVENDLDDSELNRLVHWSQSGPEAAREYCEFLKDYAVIRRLVAGQIESAPAVSDDTRFNEAVWKALQEVENTAPGIERPAAREKCVREAVCRAPLEVSRPKASPRSLAAMILSSAALLFVIIYAHVAPIDPGIEVATLSESMDAKWSDPDRQVRDGLRLVTHSKPLWLREGFATIDYDSGGRVVLEAPAEFEILRENQISLHYGRLYAIIPPEAVGFTVDTAHVKIVDLGTEFGAKVDLDGAAEVHVIQGRTMLISGAGGKSAIEQTLLQGQARAVTSAGELRDICLKREAFVRLFEPRSRFVWKGAEAVDLADIVGGGNGFGSGKIEHGIDPLTGKPVTCITPRYSIRGSGRYEAVTDSPYIDGVFVPDGGEGPIAVSSRGDRFEGCPDTNGEFWTEITNGGQLSDPVELSSPQFGLQGRQVGTAQRPAIFMHANLGITFDLQAIRETLPRLRLTEFTALAGISENGPRRMPYADFRVLVDGEERFCRAGADGSGVYPVSVSLRESDRFLTLMVTDGGEERSLKIDGVSYVLDGDWGLFAEPRLRISPQADK